MHIKDFLPEELQGEICVMKNATRIGALAKQSAAGANCEKCIFYVFPVANFSERKTL